MITVDYDRPADVLYISFGEPRPGICIEETPGILVRVADNYEVVGFTVIDAKWRLENGYPMELTPIQEADAGIRLMWRVIGIAVVGGKDRFTLDEDARFHLTGRACNSRGLAAWVERKE